MVEYGLIIALIAVGLLLALKGMQGQIELTFNRISEVLAGEGGG